MVKDRDLARQVLAIDTSIGLYRAPCTVYFRVGTMASVSAQCLGYL